MSITLSDQDVAVVQASLASLERVLGSAADGTARLSVSWQQSVMDQARAWLTNDANVVTPDPTASDVVARFRAANPRVTVTAVQVIPVAPAVPGLPPTGQYRAALSIALGAPPTPPPSPVPQTDATGGADGVGFAGSNPPPGIDTATLEATPAGATLLGSDGLTYVKAVQQEMMGYAVFWLKKP